jgi:hypothetical protein
MRRLSGLVVAAVASAFLVAPAHAAPAADEGAPSAFTPVSPVRVLDTRNGTAGPVGPGGVITVDLAGVVPSSTTAVVLNVTGQVVLYNNAGSVHLIADVAGYYAADPFVATGLTAPTTSRSSPTVFRSATRTGCSAWSQCR